MWLSGKHGPGAHSSPLPRLSKQTPALFTSDVFLARPGQGRADSLSGRVCLAAKRSWGRTCLVELFLAWVPVVWRGHAVPSLSQGLQCHEVLQDTFLILEYRALSSSLGLLPAPLLAARVDICFRGTWPTLVALKSGRSSGSPERLGTASWSL